MVNILDWLQSLPAPGLVFGTGVIALAESTVGVGFFIPGQGAMMIAAAAVSSVSGFLALWVVATVGALAGNVIGFTTATLWEALALHKAGLVSHVHTVRDGREFVSYIMGHGVYADRHQHPRVKESEHWSGSRKSTRPFHRPSGLLLDRFGDPCRQSTRSLVGSYIRVFCVIP